jgi:hypothetical protein
MSLWRILSFTSLLILTLLAGKGVVLAVEPTSSDIIITEIKLGGDPLNEEDPKEFVTIFNQTDSDITLDNWKIEYVKEGFDSANCDLSIWNQTGASPTLLEGTLQAGEALSVERSLTDTKDGSLRIVEELEESVIVHDLVGWGEAAPCFEMEPTQRPSTTTTPSKSIQRYMDCDLLNPVDMNNNEDDFLLNDQSAFGELGNTPLPDCEPDEPPSTFTCEGVLISEILPNPAGTDSGKEFIELYNPTTDFISLEGCGLQTSSSSNIYQFADVTLNPEEYKAFSNDETNLTLPNSAGGTVYLLSANDDELDSVVYAGGLEDDVAWAWFSGNEWKKTFKPTPGSANKLVATKPCPVGQERNPETGRCRSTDSESSNLTPCQTGQERNPATNRCRSILSSASTLVPCKPGQERNPATNRCRSTNSTSTLVPCKPDQERNPTTNRCRKIDSASSQLKPCEPDQERNPETNRCRKILGAVRASGPGDAEHIGPASSNQGGISGSWWLTGSAIIAASGYALWEWRYDIRNLVAKLLGRSTSAA